MNVLPPIQSPTSKRDDFGKQTITDFKNGTIGGTVYRQGESALGSFVNSQTEHRVSPLAFNQQN